MDTSPNSLPNPMSDSLQPSSDREELSPLPRTDSTPSSSTTLENNAHDLNMSTINLYSNLPFMNPCMAAVFKFAEMSGYPFETLAITAFLNSMRNFNLAFENQAPNFFNPQQFLGANHQLIDDEKEKEPMEEAKTQSVLETEQDNSRSLRGKRCYTEVKLNEAINKIQNGEMGTRRASATYGIPRSTLRNKMNKSKDAQQLPMEYEQPHSAQSTDQSNTENQITQNAEPFQQLPNLAQLMDFLQPVHNQLPPLSLPTLQTPLKSYMRNSPIQKPARGKRGQYRQYNPEVLKQAVEAVKNGMSVHKAGTIYGVPHSTLEYKVKDRSRKSQQLRMEAERQKEQQMNEAINGYSIENASPSPSNTHQE